jgi:hypothetical protein
MLKNSILIKVEHFANFQVDTSWCVLIHRSSVFIHPIDADLLHPFPWIHPHHPNSNFTHTHLQLKREFIASRWTLTKTAMVAVTWQILTNGIFMFSPRASPLLNRHFCCSCTFIFFKFKNRKMCLITKVEPSDSEIAMDSPNLLT